MTKSTNGRMLAGGLCLRCPVANVPTLAQSLASRRRSTALCGPGRRGRGPHAAPLSCPVAGQPRRTTTRRRCVAEAGGVAALAPRRRSLDELPTHGDGNERIRLGRCGGLVAEMV